MGIEEWKRRKYVASLRRYYGLTSNEYEALVVAQNGQCAICGETPRKAKIRMLQVDHNHLTEKPRGLLCQQCNQALHAVERAEWLQAALIYLASHIK